MARICAVLAVLAVVLVPHALAVLADLVRAVVEVLVVAVALGPHTLALIALTLALAIALALAWRIDVVIMRTSCGFVLTGRAAVR